MFYFTIKGRYVVHQFAITLLIGNTSTISRRLGVSDVIFGFGYAVLFAYLFPSICLRNYQIVNGIQVEININGKEKSGIFFGLAFASYLADVTKHLLTKGGEANQPKIFTEYFIYTLKKRIPPCLITHMWMGKKIF